MNYELIVGSIVALVAMAGLAFLWYKGKKKEVLILVDKLVEVAEKRFGGGAGDIKYAYVVAHVYPKLPAALRAIVTEEMLDGWIESAVNKLQEKIKTEMNKL